MWTRCDDTAADTAAGMPVRMGGAGAKARFPGPRAAERVGVDFGRLFLICLGVLLLGYAFLDKGFAYLGFAPIYVGEMVFALGVALLFWDRGGLVALRSPIAWAVLAFAAWGAARTVPYVPVYGLEALRDGALWGYAAFAVAVSVALLRTGWMHRALSWYGCWMPWFVAWAPVAYLTYSLAGERLPNIPGTEVSMLKVKPGDLAVHLAGAAGFLLAGLHRRFPRRRRRLVLTREWVWWLFWVAGFVVISARSRGGMLAMLVTLAVIVALRPVKGVFKLSLAALALFALLAIFDVSIRLPGGRFVSASQIAVNLQSVLFRGDRPELYGTVDYRLAWWHTIVGYTVFGDYFWTGKGYGVNLADDDGFQVIQEGAPLRSPHNVHVTTLARGGMPGLALWLVILMLVFRTTLLGYRRASSSGRHELSAVYLWLLAYLTASVVNATFDVYLEGPQGGIWFWSLVGFVIAISTAERLAAARTRRRDVYIPGTGAADARTPPPGLVTRG